MLYYTNSNTIQQCQKEELYTLEYDDQIETLTFQKNAGNAVQPFKGYFTGGAIEPAGCEYIEGPNNEHFLFTGKATHVGRSIFESCQYNLITGVDPETGYLLFDSGGILCPFTITAANGDLISGYYEFEGELREDRNVYFWGSLIVTAEGNSGRFVCVTGELPFNGQTTPGDNFFYIEDGYLDFTIDDCE